MVMGMTYGLKKGAAILAHRHQPHQRQDSPFAAVVEVDDVDLVLERDDDDQRPEDQRADAEDVGGCHGHGVRAVEALAHGVQGAGADVAVDDAERGKDEERDAGLLRLAQRGVSDSVRASEPLALEANLDSELAIGGIIEGPEGR